MSDQASPSSLADIPKETILVVARALDMAMPPVTPHQIIHNIDSEDGRVKLIEMAAARKIVEWLLAAGGANG